MILAVTLVLFLIASILIYFFIKNKTAGEEQDNYDAMFKETTTWTNYQQRTFDDDEMDYPYSVL